MWGVKIQSLNRRFVVNAVREGLACVNVHNGISFDYFHIIICLLSVLTVLRVSIVRELPHVQMMSVSDSVYLRLIDSVLSIEIVKVGDLEGEHSGLFVLGREANVPSVFVSRSKDN